MAHINAPFSTPHARPSLAGLGARILNMLTAIAEANPRMREIERLQAKSDEQLAAMGLNREDIARHVLKDILFI